MKILVTGATGFIGSHLVPALVKMGHKVRCLVRKTSNISKLQKLKNVEFFYGNITDKRTLKGLNKGVEAVFNVAGALGKWNNDDRDLAPVNIEGVRNLLEIFKGSKIKKFIHLSAGGVTGPVKNGLADETYPCQPSTPYEKTKYEGERLALKLGQAYSLPVVVVRPTFTYGPDDPHKLNLFKLVKKRFFIFVGNGKSLYHPVYIDDLIQGVLLAFEKGKPGEVYIIGGEESVSKKELVNTIAESLNVKLKAIYAPYPLMHLAALIMEMGAKILRFEPILTRSRVSAMGNNWGCNISKAKKELGYKPQVSLAEGIRKTVKWYQKGGYL